MVEWIIYIIGWIITLPILGALISKLPGGSGYGDIQEWDTPDYVLFGILLMLGVFCWPVVWILVIAALVGWGAFRLGVRIRNVAERKFGL